MLEQSLKATPKRNSPVIGGATLLGPERVKDQATKQKNRDAIQFQYTRHKLIKTAAFFETNAFYGLHPTNTTWPTPTKNILQKYALAQDRNRCCILCFTVFPLYNGPTPDTHRKRGVGGRVATV